MLKTKIGSPSVKLPIKPNLQPPKSGGKPFSPHSRPSVPMSESTDKRIYTASAQDCINDLRALAEANPEQVISRNYYRNNGKYAESVWNRFFGTFHEFKRQAGITLTRQQHMLEKHIAKHAASDHYRELNSERADYGEKYLRPHGRRYQMVLAASDFHDIECDQFALRCFIDTAKRAQPDVICLAGDVFDLPEFSKFTQDPRQWNIVGRIKHVHEQILRPLREAAPDAQLDLIEGNHTARLLKHLADATPAMQTLLSDLHGMTVPKLLGLEEFQVNYVAKLDLAAYNTADIRKELYKNYRVYYDCLLAHHFPDGNRLGLPGFCGHHHKHICWSHPSAIYGTFEFHQMGGMCRRSATYTNGEIWSNGFIMAHVDTHKHNTCFEYVDVKDHASIGGRLYIRGEQEI